MSEQQAPEIGANGRGSGSSEPRVVRQIQTTVTIIVGVQQGRRTLKSFPLGGQNGTFVEHSREAYAALYDDVERAMDVLQERVDRGEDEVGDSQTPSLPTAGQQIPPTVPAGSF